jgi:hypothetical protein
MSKQKISLAHLNQPADSMDALLLGAAPTVSPMPEPEQYVKVRFTNALPATTFQRLQQYSFWSHETIGDVLEEALTRYFEQRPEADKPLPAKQAAKKRRGR